MTPSAIIPLEYSVLPLSPQAHLFAVELSIPVPTADPLVLSLPAWIPGSYLIRDFARHIVRIAAWDQVGALVLEKQDKQTWRLPHRGLGVQVRVEVHAWDLSVRAAYLDDRRGFFNGSSLFLRVQGLDRLPCRLAISPPSGENYAGWRLATSLKPLATQESGFGSYQAADYADLIDHPVEMGQFRLLSFEIQGVPHRLVLSGRHQVDEARLEQDLVRICATHAALFDGLPIDRYLFLTQVSADGYGGLEHAFSTALICARDDLPRPGMDAPTPGYRRFLGLCSHEYFHLWHVKRIRPRAFQDQGLDREVHTRLLWVFEGITSYYDDLALVRGGCIDEAGYLELLAEALTRVQHTPGRLIQTLAESSFDAWIKYYQPDENSPNAVISYYAKGALVALALDLIIRRDTRGARSLDDVMLALWERHGRTGLGLEERGFEALAMEVAGLDLTDFFQQALDSTQDLDLAPLLAEMGIGLRLRAARHAKDFGGLATTGTEVGADRAAAPPGVPQNPALPNLGIRLRPEGSEAVLATVFTGGPAQAAGLAPGDTLVALDGLRISRDNLDKLLMSAGEGAEVEIHAFRRNELQVRRARLAPAPLDTCELWLLADAPEEAQARRAAWLGRQAGLAPAPGP